MGEKVDLAPGAVRCGWAGGCGAVGGLSLWAVSGPWPGRRSCSAPAARPIPPLPWVDAAALAHLRCYVIACHICLSHLGSRPLTPRGSRISRACAPHQPSRACPGPAPGHRRRRTGSERVGTNTSTFLSCHRTSRAGFSTASAMPARAPELHRPQRATLSGRSSLSASLIDLSDVSSQEESQLDSASRLGLSSLAPFAPPACPYSQMLARTRSQDLTDSDPWLHTSMLSGGLASPPDPKQHHESLSFLPVPHTPNLSEGPPAPSAPDPTSHQQQPWQQGTSPCFPPLDFLEVCVHVLSDHFPDMEVATEAIAQSLQMAYPRRKVSPLSDRPFSMSPLSAVCSLISHFSISPPPHVYHQAHQ